MALWTDAKLKVATIGCGRMGAQTSPGMQKFAPPYLRILSHLEAARSLDLASALAASDTSPEALARATDAFALDYATPDYRELIAEFRPDILTIATRTPDKAGIIAAAAAAGIKAIHVEKPLCNTAAELAQIAGLVREHDLLMTSGCLRRYLTPFRSIEGVFASHELGQVTHVSVGMGVASLMWTQFHAIDLLLFYAGGRRLDWVQANLGPIVWDGEAVVQNDPVVLSATLAFEGGFIGAISQTVGNTTILSSALGQLELFADGRTALLGHRAQAGDVYLTKSTIDLEAGDLSGTQAPLWYLAKALTGDAYARELVGKAGAEFQTAQRVALALVESDRDSGRRILMDGFHTNLTIRGVTDGRYA